ncbi:MAG: hypothetical protein AAF829_10135 [Pseudomonadota bacterium]
MNFAVLLARQRSGTGAIGSVLDKHPDLKYVGEVFHPDNVGEENNYFTFFQQSVATNPDLALPSAAPDVFKAFIARLNERYGEQKVVIDIKYRSLHHCAGGWKGLVDRPWLITMARNNKAPILHLTRKNYVESFVSGRLAEANQVWHARSDEQAKVKSAVINVRHLSGYITSIDREVSLIRDWIRGYPLALEFDYSDLVGADGLVTQDIAQRLSKTLSVPPFADRAPAFIKQAPSKVADAIENLELVRQALAGTGHAWMVK